MTKKELARDFEILKSQWFIKKYHIEWDKRTDEYYKVFYTDYYGNEAQRLVFFDDKSDELRQDIREFIEKTKLEEARKTNSVWILERMLYNGFSVCTATFSDYKKAKKEFDELKNIWEQDGMLKDAVISDNYIHSDYGTIQIFESFIH